MNSIFDFSITHGFTINVIHGKQLTLLKDSNYNSLQQCDTLEDIISKLNPFFKLSQTINSKKEFKDALYSNLKNEYNKLYKGATDELKLLLDYYINRYKILNFIYLLACKENDPELTMAFTKIDEIGLFNELYTLKFSNDMSDVYKFCVESTFLKNYYVNVKFNREIKDNDFQLIQLQFLKQHLEDFYGQLEDTKSMDFMKNVLKREGDRIIIEIVLNTLDSSIKDREKLFPRVNSLDLGMKKRLGKCTAIDELRGILGTHNALRKVIMEDDIIKAISKIENEKYWETFKIYNDISCVYGYLKLREQEIKNVLWVVECVSLKKRDFIKNVIVEQET